jgi:hypothetical protein
MQGGLSFMSTLASGRYLMKQNKVRQISNETFGMKLPFVTKD